MYQGYEGVFIQRLLKRIGLLKLDQEKKKSLRKTPLRKKPLQQKPLRKKPLRKKKLSFLSK